MSEKPLKRKAYGSIGHLPNSRMGPGDHAVPDGMASICCKKTRDRLDRVVIQEKLDGSCVAVAKLDGKLVPLGRAGYPAVSSPWRQHRFFHDWVFGPAADDFHDVLSDGERIVGELLVQAHSTRYQGQVVFVAFDIMTGSKRVPFDEFTRRVRGRFVMPYVVSTFAPMPAEDALRIVQERNYHRAQDSIEGVVYRVERDGEVDFLAKYVRPDKVDGKFLPGCCGNPKAMKPVWNVLGLSE